KVANENVPALAPIRSHDQILPFNACVPIRKTYVPATYIQLFWNTLTHEAKTGVYRFQLDEDWFILNASLIREALEINPIDQAHNINQRSGSPFNLAKDDHRLGNLKFVPKGKEDEVIIMQIPKELIMKNIRNAPYYNAYMETVAKHDHKTAAKEGGMKKSAAKSDQSKKPTTAKQPKLKVAKGKVRKVRKGKSSLQLVDEPDEEPQPDPKPQVEDEEFDLQRGIQIRLDSFQAHGQAPVGGVAFREPASGITQKLPIVKGKGKCIATDEHVAQSLLDLHKPKKKSTIGQFLLQRHTPATKEASTGPSAQSEDDTSVNIVRDTLSCTDAKTGADTDKTSNEGYTEILNISGEQGEDIANKVDLEEKTVEIDEGHDGSDLGKTPKSRPPPECVLMKEDQAGPNTKESHHSDEEHVYVENPLSSTGTLSSLKNLDAYTFGDQFFNDKPTEEDSRKTNMKTKVESMVTVLIHQASSSVPPLSKPVFDLTPPKPVSPTIQEPVFAAITKTATTILPPPPP
nr:hypothetical protein [Tanacetum cinerariifolium]